MPTVIFLRHGRTTANAAGVLAGWTPDVHLDERGSAQAESAAQRIADVVTPARIVASPLVRCQETARPLVRVTGVRAETDEAIGECRYGAWTGRSIAELSKEPLWDVVQQRPSEVTFPPSDEFEHESMRAMQQRAVERVRAIDAEVAQTTAENTVWVIVSHGDVIKALLADACAMALDDFQRIVVGPASLSVVRYTSARPYVLRINDTGEGLKDVVASQTTGQDATVGGSTGAEQDD